MTASCAASSPGAALLAPFVLLRVESEVVEAERRFLAALGPDGERLKNLLRRLLDEPPRDLFARRGALPRALLS